MNSNDFLTLTPFAFITVYTPGPSSLSSASMGINFGIKKTMPFLYGISLGCLIVMLISGAFSGLVFRAFPSFQAIMRWVGAAYILYLAYGTFKNSFSFQDNREKYLWDFNKGLLLQLLNPKGLIFSMTLYSTFLASIVHQPYYVCLFSLAIALLVFSGVLTWASFGAFISQYLHRVKLRVLLNSILSLLLVYTAIKITGLLD